MKKNKKINKVFKNSSKGFTFLNKKIVANKQIVDIPDYGDESHKDNSFYEIFKKKHKPIMFKEAITTSTAYIVSMYLTSILSFLTFFQLDHELGYYKFNDCKFSVKNQSKKRDNLFIQTLVFGTCSPLFILFTAYLFKKSLDEVRNQKKMGQNINNTNDESTNMKNAKIKLFRSSILNLAGNLLIPIVFYAKIRPDYINLIDSYKNDKCWKTVNQDSFDGTEITLTTLGVITILFPLEVLYLYRVLHQKVDEIKEMVNANMLSPLLPKNESNNNEKEIELANI